MSVEKAAADVAVEAAAAARAGAESGAAAPSVKFRRVYASHASAALRLTF